MTDYPITVPLELVEKWGHDANLSGVPYNDQHWAYEQHIATRAAQWGADAELEACCEWLSVPCPSYGRELRNARRPKAPSLKEQALEQLDGIAAVFRMTHGGNLVCDTIRRALEALPE
jgi:hypothetical protein